MHVYTYILDWRRGDIYRWFFAERSKNATPTSRWRPKRRGPLGTTALAHGTKRLCFCWSKIRDLTILRKNTSNAYFFYNFINSILHNILNHYFITTPV